MAKSIRSNRRKKFRSIRRKRLEKFHTAQLEATVSGLNAVAAEKVLGVPMYKRPVTADATMDVLRANVATEEQQKRMDAVVDDSAMQTSKPKARLVVEMDDVVGGLEVASLGATADVAAKGKKGTGKKGTAKKGGVKKAPMARGKKQARTRIKKN